MLILHLPLSLQVQIHDGDMGVVTDEVLLNGTDLCLLARAWTVVQARGVASPPCRQFPLLLALVELSRVHREVHIPPLLIFHLALADVLVAGSMLVQAWLLLLQVIPSSTSRLMFKLMHSDGVLFPASMLMLLVAPVRLLLFLLVLVLLILDLSLSSIRQSMRMGDVVIMNFIHC